MNVDGNKFMSGNTLRWASVPAIFLLDASWLSVSGYSVKTHEALAIFLLALAGLAVLEGAGQLSRYRKIARHPYAQRARLTLHATFLLAMFSTAASLLQYLLITLNVPLIDQQLAAADRALGFDWVQFFHWVRNHRFAYVILRLAYVSLLLQFVAVPWVLGLSGSQKELNEFVNCVMFSSLLLLLIAGPFPAHSAFVYYGLGTPLDLASVGHFDLLRSGAMQVFDIDQFQGLISLPSYHTALAVILTYALRNCRYVFWCALPLNILMIFSTPTEGGHFLVDTIAGLILALITIVAMRRFSPKESKLPAPEFLRQPVSG